MSGKKIALVAIAAAIAGLIQYVMIDAVDGE